MAKTWLITGCSSGLGKELATAVLAHGDNCVVTARKPEAVAELVAQYPDTAVAARLDVNDLDSIAEAVAAADRFGGVDVLVNNAGYCLRGAVEECTRDEIVRQFDTNVFGPVAVMQAVLPQMRARRSGVIVNYSSIAALRAAVGSGYYAASKAAIELISDALRGEVEPLGIRVMVVEPGPFGTDFYSRSLDVNEARIADYAETAGTRKVRQDNAGKMGDGWGSPAKAAQTVITAVEAGEAPFRLLLGSVAIAAAEGRAKGTLEEVEKFRDLILSSDV